MAPRSTSQNPAIMRSSVVLPHPDGPSSVKNSPSATVMEMSSTARTDPNVRVSASRRIVVTCEAPQWSSGILDRRLQAVQRVSPRRIPFGVVVGDDLQLRQRGHTAGDRSKVDVLPRRATERGAEQRLLQVLAIEEVDERARRLGVRARSEEH